MEYIALSFVVHREGEYYVSECLELGVSSFGTTEDQAIANLGDATEVYLNTLEDLGETRLVLKERGVEVFQYEPANIEVRRRVKIPIGSCFRPTAMRLPHKAAG
jgi:predicted RNase H-like HicB family nuclease